MQNRTFHMTTKVQNKVWQLTKIETVVLLAWDSWNYWYGKINMSEKEIFIRNKIDWRRTNLRNKVVNYGNVIKYRKIDSSSSYGLTRNRFKASAILYSWKEHFIAFSLWGQTILRTDSRNYLQCFPKKDIKSIHKSFFDFEWAGTPS